MPHRIKCFVSFSTTDTDQRDVRFFLSYLRKRLADRIDFRVYFEQKPGADLQRFMLDDLNSSDAAIILFTPDYKRKADNAEKSGALNEYMRIVDLLEDPSKREIFLVVPVAWRGSDFKSALPAYFLDRHLTIDLRNFRAYGSDKREAYLPKTFQADLELRLDDLAEALRDHWQFLDPKQMELTRRVNKKLLEEPTIEDVTIVDPIRPGKHRSIGGNIAENFFFKAERSGISIKEFTARYFTKTNFYNQLGRLHKVAFTGRKGSGKTTFLQVYKYQNRRRYFSPIDIQVNDWNLHYVLGDLTFKQAQGDFSYTQEESRVFDFVWAVFLSFCLVRSLSETAKASRTEDARHHANQILRSIQPVRFRTQFAKSMRTYSELFQLSSEFVKFFIQQSIDNASTHDEGEFRRDLTHALTVQSCTELLLGSGYESIIEYIQNDPTNRRFLFCLDRFDTEIQQYRKDTIQRVHDPIERATREAREVSWIQALVELIDNLRSPDYFSLHQGFYKTFGPHVDFCVPLPKDRIVEVQRRRRDSISGPAQEEILWQPLELLTALRKRLQQVWDISDEQLDKRNREDATERFNRCVDLSRRKIPQTTTIRIGTAEYDIDLFLGVLRHTFFRPRDVMIYYSKIVSYIEGINQRKGLVPNSAAIKRLISHSTNRIVEEEFIGEFGDTIVNLRDILRRFRGQPEILAFRELEVLIGDIPFQLFADEQIKEVGQKIRVLYEIGFLGVVCTKSHSIGGFPIEDFHFYFINTQIASSLEMEEINKQLVYAVHPVFIETLNLKLGGHKPVLYLNWDQIREWDQYDPSDE